MDSEFHPRLLEDAAAWLFWTLASRDGFGPTLENLLKTRGRSLLDCPDRESIFAGYLLDHIPSAKFIVLCDAIAGYAFRRAASEENLVGMVYSEDRLLGRAPSAAAIRTEHLNLPVTVIGDTLPVCGTLCLRHPLPAVVFASAPPPKGFFRIANTDTLGFSMPLWLDPDSVDEIEDGCWLLTGIFYIPENLALAGRPWTEVIPNAVCAREGMVLNGQRGAVNLYFHWGYGDNGKAAGPRRLMDKLRASWLGRLPGRGR